MIQRRNHSTKNKRNQSTIKADSKAALDAVHAIMHLFDPENHNLLALSFGDGYSMDGLRFYADLTDWLLNNPTSSSAFGYLGFGKEVIQLMVLFLDDNNEVCHTYALDSFEYTDPKLLRRIAAALPQVGVEIPDGLQSEIDELQANLNQEFSILDQA